MADGFAAYLLINDQKGEHMASSVQNVPTVAELLKSIHANQKELSILENKVVAIRDSISYLPFTPLTMKTIENPVYFQNISQADFNVLLTSLVTFFLSQGESYVTNFKQILETRFSQVQFAQFVHRYTSQLLLKEEALQQKSVCNLLALITLNRIKAIAAETFPPATFERNLFRRVKSDALIFPSLSNYQPPNDFSTKCRTIWKICIEDMENFLEAFDRLTGSPTRGQDAMFFVNSYQMAMKVATSLTGEKPPQGSEIALGLIPFMMNAIRKVYMHYYCKTPSASALNPLVHYSDPHFYEGVAPINNRNQILEEVAQAWSQNITPILVGAPGCGKTSILIEIARRIHLKKFPGFNGGDYKAFGGSATSLASIGGIEHIERLLKKIGAKREFTILLLEEIHAFSDSQKNLLSSFFDHSPHSIRYAVFATTTDGAKEFFKGDDGSLARRFININVPDLSKDETKFVLYHQARSMSPTMMISCEVIERIVTASEGNFAKSIKLLCHVLRKALNKNIACPSQKAYNEKVTQLKVAEETHLNHLGRIGNGRQQSADIIYEMEIEKNALEAKLEKERLVIKNHVIYLTKRTQLTYRVLDVSQKILKDFQGFLLMKGENIKQITPAKEENYFLHHSFQKTIESSSKEFIYYNVFLNDVLNNKISEFEKEYDLISEITNEFITDDDLKME